MWELSRGGFVELIRFPHLLALFPPTIFDGIELDKIVPRIVI